MHRTPEPPPGGGSRSFDKLAWRPTHGAYLALAKHAQEACAGGKAGPTAMLEPPLGGGAGEPHPRALAQSGLRLLCSDSRRTFHALFANFV